MADEDKSELMDLVVAKVEDPTALDEDELALIAGLASLTLDSYSSRAFQDRVEDSRASAAAVEEVKQELEARELQTAAPSKYLSLEARLQWRDFARSHEFVIDDLVDALVWEEVGRLKRQAALSEEQEAAVDAALSPYGSDSEVVVVFQTTDIHKIETRTLRPGVWVRDEVINMYIQMLQIRNDDDPSRFGSHHFFNTFFYAKLMEGGVYDYSRVRRWTRRVDLFSKDKIFVPINVSSTHWCMAMVSVKAKMITFCDSLRGEGRHAMANILRYLGDELKDKKQQTLNSNEWRMGADHTLPRQMNGYDCGVFMCTYMEHLSENQPMEFATSDMVKLRRRIAACMLQQFVP